MTNTMWDRNARLMDYLRGGVGGIIAGVLSGILYIVLSFVIAAMICRPITFSEMIFISNALLFNLYPLLPSILISGVVGGALFGLFYAATYPHLPGTTSINKGVFLGGVYWFIAAVILGLIRTIPYFTISKYSTLLLTGLASYLLFGYLLGLTWDKLRIT